MGEGKGEIGGEREEVKEEEKRGGETKGRRGGKVTGRRGKEEGKREESERNEGI
jgi:hypothetical protein